MAADEHYRRVCARVAQLLRANRVRQKLSMNEVAQRAGLSQQMVSYVERGMRNPTLETLIRIASAIDVDLADILKRAIRESRK